MSPVEVFGTGDQDFWSAKIMFDHLIVSFWALMIAWFTVVKRLNWQARFPSIIGSLSLDYLVDCLISFVSQSQTLQQETYK